VLDLNLPREDGLTLCRDLRALEHAGDHADRARRADRPRAGPGNGRR
jgi:CheY-like chemotaxis protein